MSPDHERRLAAAEAAVAVANANIETLTKAMAEANRKLDQLVAAANMGKGAWWLLLRLGGLVVGVVALVVSIETVLGLHR
jgi:hypothetical protein